VASKDDEQRVRDLTERDIKRTLRDVRIPDVVIGRVLAQWPEFRADDEWCRCSRRSLRGLTSVA